MQEAKTSGAVRLPDLSALEQHPVERLIARRRSVREFSGEALSLAELGRLLWAAQGITDETGLRTAPSAGALYPLELAVAAGRVTGLPPGLYRYRPQTHSLKSAAPGDVRTALARAALGQSCIATAAAVVVFAAVIDRCADKYGERAFRYVSIEVGHAAQNVCLVAEALGLGTVVVGAFDDDAVRRSLRLAGDETPLTLMPLGRRLQ
jgi:SagB-type dehydrogenase family enzyme